MMNAPIEQFIT